MYLGSIKGNHFASLFLESPLQAKETTEVCQTVGSAAKSDHNDVNSVLNDMIVEQHDSKSKPARKPRGRKQNKVEDCAPLTAKTDSLTSTTEDPVVVPDNVDAKLNKKSEVARQSASQDGVSSRPTRARRKPKKLMDDETPSTSKPDIRDKMPSTSKTTEACNETSKQLLNGKEINDKAQQTEAEQSLPDKISTSAAKTKRAHFVY